MKHHPPHMLKVGDFLLSRSSPIIETIIEIDDTEESISFYIGMCKIGPASNDPTRSVHDVRREYIYLKKEDKWVWTGEGDVQVCKETPKFYLEITREMDRNEQLNKILE
jgi:hypothetical protein